MHPTSEEDVKKIDLGKWTTGLYDCWDDRSLCFLTCFCPCVAFGRTAEIIDRGETASGLAELILVAMASIGFWWVYGFEYRSKLRRHFSLTEEPCSDCLVHGFCCFCALSQEYRELKNRGADPSLGWQGNVDKWKMEGTTPPIVIPGMNR